VTKSDPGQGPWRSCSTGTESGGDGFTRREDKQGREGGRRSQLYKGASEQPRFLWGWGQQCHSVSWTGAGSRLTPVSG